MSYVQFSRNSGNNIWLLFNASNGDQLLLQLQDIEPNIGFYKYVNGNWSVLWAK